MTPEEKARQTIDQWFYEAGWEVVGRDQYEPNMSAVAVREGMLTGHLEADYLLFVGGKAVGVLEAKREEADIRHEHITRQVEQYAHRLSAYYQSWFQPLPLVYKSNGRELLFRNLKNPDSDYQEVRRMHTPREIVRLLGIESPFAALPRLRRDGLRECQYEAITELEKSFRSGQKRALMVLATGAGKTYTACLAAYRFLAYTPMRRVLFLVDRNNLGEQAESAFGAFRLTETGDPFNTLYSVHRLRSGRLPSDTNLVISTIQRLYSLLSGTQINDNNEDEDQDWAENSSIELPLHPTLPPNYFDLIIIDECHRSIYGSWRSVLEYFSSARMVGLTATPVPETLAFFNNNRVVNYTLGQSIIDGVNVDQRIYRIKTRVTTSGGAIMEGDPLQVETRYTGQVQQISNQETRAYTREELNRSIVNPSQIKLILTAYRDAVYNSLYPEREPVMDYLPKTLIFALNEAHATNIVRIGKEVFGRSDDQFIRKITYAAGDSNTLIRQFRTDKAFRIAVTCTLVATGTDIQPLEVVMFMRDVRSQSLYNQMRGRGVRVIGDEQLRSVTPNATSKECFFLVDAVGVTEHEYTTPELSRGPIREVISLKELLERIAHGYLPDSYMRRLAATLARLHNKANQEQQDHFRQLSGESMREVAQGIYRFLEDEQRPPFEDINQPNPERKHLVAPIAHRSAVRDYIRLLAAGFVTTLQPGEDTLIFQGFSVEEAQQTTDAFERYIQAHRDDVEALRILYNTTGEPITYAMLTHLEEQLMRENNRFAHRQLWNSYAIARPSAVKRTTRKEEIKALTNIIQLVRFGYRQIERLESIPPTARQYFNLWCGQNQRSLTPAQQEVLAQVVSYIASNGACLIQDIRADNQTRAAQMIQAFGGIPQANAALNSLYNFIVLRKTA